MNSSTSSSDPAGGPGRRGGAALTVAATAALGFLALFATSELFVRESVAPLDNFRKHVAFFHKATAADAAFGDSHVARGFAAAPGFINLAFPSENIPRIAWKVHRYYRDQRPGRVILQADPHMFAAYRLRVGLGPYPAAFDGEGHRAPLYLLDTRYRPQVIAYWKAALRHGGTLTSSVDFSPSGSLLSGGNLARVPARKVQLAARYRVRAHQPLPRRARAQDARVYRALVRWLAARGARICLVSFPVSPAYLRALEETRTPQQRRRWREAAAFFREVAAGSGAVYADHRRLFADPALFRDVDHLNRAGARTYAPMLLHACFGPGAVGR